jgi:hypothetical protein
MDTETAEMFIYPVGAQSYARLFRSLSRLPVVPENLVGRQDQHNKGRL